MAEKTEALIERLAADAGPVRRLQPPAWRATWWLLSFAAAGAVAVWLLADPSDFAKRAHEPGLWVELAAILATGIAAVLAAFHASVPDRSPLWGWAPIPPLALWLLVSGAGCYSELLVHGAEGWSFGEGFVCLRLIILISVPLGLVLLPVLRRAHPLQPIRVATLGGLGIAALAAFLLQFFHPADATFLDLGFHIVAIAAVTAAVAALPRLRAV